MMPVAGSPWSMRSCILRSAVFLMLLNLNRVLFLFSAEFIGWGILPCHRSRVLEHHRASHVFVLLLHGSGMAVRCKLVGVHSFLVLASLMQGSSMAQKRMLVGPHGHA